MSSTSRFLRVIYFLPTLFLYSWGLLIFKVSGKTPKLSYKSLRFLHVITNGWINTFSNKLISFTRRPKKSSENIHSVLGDFSNEKIDKIIDSLNKDGCYIFEEKLSPQIIQDISDFGSTTPAQRMEGLGKYDNNGTIVNKNTIPESPRYQFKNEQLLQNKNLTNVICDDLFLTISEKYLKCRPIFDYFVMWWSFPYRGKMTSEAAQKYHFDMDRIKFLKFFFYVTDVDTNSGPHCFVKGSHNHKHTKLRKDGRIEDSEIEKYSKKENIVEICGQKGTVMIVDTIGFHKGKVLTENSRLLFQILYSNSLFGAKTNCIELPKNVYEDNKDFLEANRDVFNKTLTY